VETGQPAHLGRLVVVAELEARMRLAFTVFGVAVPKGNMRAIHLKGMQYPIVTDSNRNVKSWSQLVAEGANRALAQLPEAERTMLDGAVRLTVAFYLPRPKKFKRGVPVAHLTTPDWDKLARAIGDALAHVVYHDDKQIVEAVIGKFYAEADAPPRVDIRVEPTGGIRPSVVPAAPLPLFEEEPCSR
jgi:Holliday junction resolvase RusA-like endonuclease